MTRHRQCRYCGKDFEALRKQGRPPEFCSPEHANAHTLKLKVANYTKPDPLWPSRLAGEVKSFLVSQGMADAFARYVRGNWDEKTAEKMLTQFYR